MAKNPTDVAAKWSRNLGAASESIKAGVQAVTVSPTEKAAAAQDRYVQGVQRAAASGDYARGLRKVSLSDWQNAMINKGLPRVASGAAAAKPKMEAFLGKWLPYMDGLKSRLASMPRGDLQQNISRMVESVQYAAAFKNT